MTRRIAFINEKGGSCKTTLTVNIGAYLALRKNVKVLLVDMDPQGHLGKSLGFNVREVQPTVVDFLTNPDVDYSNVVNATRIQGLDIIISNKTLTDYTINAIMDSDKFLKLKQKIDKISGYDYILFDSPPSLGIITLNIINAVDEIVIPVNLTYFAMDGCAEILDTVENVKNEYNNSLEIKMIVPTLYRNTNLANAILEKLKEHFDTMVSDTVIRYNVKIDESQSHGLTIWEYDPSSSGAQMLTDIAEELVRV